MRDIQRLSSGSSSAGIRCVFGNDIHGCLRERAEDKDKASARLNAHPSVPSLALALPQYQDPSTPYAQCTTDSQRTLKRRSSRVRI